MAENIVPTLLVGLGGVGCSIIDLTSSMLPKEKKRYVGAVGIDTNIEDLRKLEHIKPIWIGQEGLVKDILNTYPETVGWFPGNKYIINKGIRDGAGQIRAISRLAVYAATKGDKDMLLILQNEIKRILEHSGDVSISKFNVFIAGSITGGTGAGSFLQIPFYIKEYVKKNFSATSVTIRGMFVSADLTASVQPNVINRDAVKVNAYACMKELNAFYLTQTLSDDQNLLELDFYDSRVDDSAYDKADRSLRAQGCRPGDNVSFDEYREMIQEMTENGANVPYNSFYIVEGADNEGGVGLASLETVKYQIARIIFTLLFTPIRGVQAGIDDNGILMDMLANGMNRYSSAGLCSLHYPYEQMVDYVTVAWAKELIGEEWTLIDKSYELEKKVAMDQKKINPAVKIPEIEEAYVRLFKKQSHGGEGTRLGHLKQEAFIIPDSPTATPISRSKKFFDDMEEAISEIINDNVITNAEKKCTINAENMRDINEASGEAIKIMNGVEELMKKMNNLVERSQYEIANRVFPVSRDALLFQKEDPLSIYQFIGNTHPVAARNLIYEVMIRLDQEIRELEGNGLKMSDLREFKNTSYASSGKEKKNIQKAIEEAKEYKIGLVFSGAKGRLRTISSQFSQAVSGQIAKIKTYGDTQMKLTTYRILKRRFKKLSEVYESFFRNISSRVEENEIKMEVLEHAFEHKIFGERIIYGSADAMKATLREFSSGNRFELTEPLKNSIFLGIFQFTCVGLKNDETGLSHAVHLAAEEKMEKGIEMLFDTAVIDNIKEIVMTKGRNIVDISIKEAISKQMMMEKGIGTEDPRYEEERLEYERHLIEMAMREAAPMLAVSNDQNISGNVYLAMHPESGELLAGKVDQASTKNRLVPAATEATDMKEPYVILDKGFSKYEMICLKAKHSYVIENLTKYRKDSEFAQKYNERIRNLNQEPMETGEDAFKTVANPHLNQFWHEDAFIPQLTEEEREKSRRDIYKAFYYAMGMDVFYRDTEAGLSGQRWKYYSMNREKLVKQRKQAINNGYSDLFNSLKFNKYIVASILETSAAETRRTKRDLDVMDIQHAFESMDLLTDWIQAEKEEDDENLIDILTIMRRNERMPENEWSNLVLALKIVLKEYFTILFDRNWEMINDFYQETLDMLYRYSVAGAKEENGEELDPVEKKVSKLISEMKKDAIIR